MVGYLILFLVPLLLSAQPEARTALLLLQDRRVTGSQELIAFLSSSDPKVREQALCAMANIQDTSYLPSIIPMLSDPAPKVREMAAFAVGMTPAPSGTAALFRRLSVEREQSTIAALFNAIGMSGTIEDLRTMIRQTESYPDAWDPYVAQSLTRFSVRRIRDSGASKYLVELLDDPRSVTAAAYALMRGGDTTVVRANGGRILRLLNSTSPTVRMWGATMAGVLEGEEALARLTKTVRNDKDWRVRVNAVRALRTKPAAGSVLTALFASPSEHLALASVESYAVLTSTSPQLIDSAAVRRALSAASVLPSVKDQLRRLAAQRFGDAAIPLIGQWNEGKVSSHVQRLRALGETRSVKALPMVKEALKNSMPSVVQCAAIEAFQTIARNAPADVQRDFVGSAVGMIGTRDAGVSYTAAAALQDTALTAALRSGPITTLTSVFGTLRAPADLEPMVELLNLFALLRDSAALPAVMNGLKANDRVIRNAAVTAFRSITGSEPEGEAEVMPAPQQWFRQEDLTLLDRYIGADIVTSQGKIRITFAKGAAPLTVLNFILLSRKGFYDGLSFHRVVSNFVIQGGDPLGNGSGGPEYAIRTEVHPAALYRQGAAGMASSGKDTEGSQWFITHCPTPHLDYRYTIFGYTRDAAVVDRIMIGDTIQKVTLF